MNYGLYLSASGVLTNMHRQDVAANNLANASTAGFKRSLAAIRQRDPEAMEDPMAFDVSHALLDRLGGGVLLQPSRLDASEGPLSPTGNELDLAIRGEGFFVVGGPDGSTAEPKLTRDGRFTLSADGRIVTTAGGRPLLDTGGRPIILAGDARLHIDQAGQVRQNGSVVAQVQLIDPGDASRVRHIGHGLYEPEAAVLAEPARAGGRIEQGFIEQSNVDPVMELLGLIKATKSIAASGNLIRYHDSIMDRAVNVLGRVA